MSRTVIDLFAGSVPVTRPSASLTATRIPANSGRYVSTGASKSTSPRSFKIIIATPVTGLVIEARRNIVSRDILRPVSRSATP